MLRNWQAAFVAAMLLLPATGVAQAQPVDFRSPAGKDWLTVGGGWSNARYSSLDQVNRSNVDRLNGAWMARLHGSGYSAKYSQQATPIVKDGVMYLSTGQQDFFALDARTGENLWEYISDDVDAKIDGQWANRGLAVGEGMVFAGRMDGTVIALDEKTGRRAWKSQVGETPTFVPPIAPGFRSYSQVINSAPLYWNGIVYTGLSGGDRGLRGRVTALDAKTGQELWRFYNVPAPGEPGGDTWPQDTDGYRRGGGALWHTPALDPDLGMLYYNTGNPYPDFDGSVRPGDNLFTASIVALDARTGQYRWHYQVTRHDIWDFDAPTPVVLFDQEYDGVMRKGVAVINATGWIFMFDRATGEPLIPIEQRAVPQEPRQLTAATQPYPARGESVVPQCITNPPPGYESGCYYDVFWDIPNRSQPGSGPRWGPMSYSPLTGYFYVTSALSQTALKRVDDFLGAFVPVIGSPQTGQLAAVDSRTNTVVWRKPLPYRNGNGSGAMTTAGGLVLHGHSDGNVMAFDAWTGDELWKFQTGFGAEAGVVSYQLGAEQYFAIATGGTNLNGSAKGDAVWSFKIGGTVYPLNPPPAPPTVVGFSGPLAPTDAVDIGDFAYAPQRIVVSVGTTVTWTNHDGAAHTASDQGGSWDTGLLAQGQSGSVAFDRRGSFTYFCQPHPWMVAELVVR